MPSAFDGQLPNDWDTCHGCNTTRRIVQHYYGMALCQACDDARRDSDMAADTSHRTGGKSYLRGARIR